MSCIGTVNCHVHKSGRQAFEIDSGGIAGNLISPELIATDVPLSDIRVDKVSTDFGTDSFAFAEAPMRVTDFEARNGWRGQYDRELTDLLSRTIAAQEVVVFDHTVRIDDPNTARRPARNVHSDYSPEGAERRLIDILGPDRAAAWSAGHYAFIKVWRPVENPINIAPLGFVRPASVAASDWIEIDLIYPDRRGQIMGLVANDRHEWVYLSRMTPDEVFIFNIHGNGGRSSVAHSAIDRVEDATVPTIRKSVESRTLVRF